MPLTVSAFVRRSRISASGVPDSDGWLVTLNRGRKRLTVSHPGTRQPTIEQVLDRLAVEAVTFNDSPETQPELKPKCRALATFLGVNYYADLRETERL